MNIDDDDRLPDDPFGSDEKVSIEDLVKADKEDEEAEDEILNANKKDGQKKVILLGVAGLVVACGLVTGFLYLNPFGANGVFGKSEENKSNIVQQSDGGNSDNNHNKEDGALVDDEDLFYEEDGKYFPTNVNKWAQKEYVKDDFESTKSDIAKDYAGTELGSASNTLPSESSGYTSDDSKTELSDGSLNPYYSYWTTETFEADAGSSIERLLNPTFGGWALYQYSAYPANKYYDPAILNDMFTSDWKTRNAEKKYSDYVPIYADWDGTNYGMSNELLESGPRWYGEVTSSNTDFEYDDETNQYVVNYTADVKFTAWSKDQTKLEKNGKLTIKFVANSDDQGDASHKVLIDDASLKVDK